ncbi:hypothetical protein R9X47_13720 [Wukongibacter baidiensis]|uniref:hypothetical protein n=1 Tax=Wukongibacter baidiensis TaxID=1723361 RepID=UPI003D7F4C32
MIAINRQRFIWMSIAVIIIAYVIFAFPVKINKELPAVRYRLGDEKFAENITIKIDGRYVRKLFSDDVFVGTIYIEGYEFTDDSSGFRNLKSTLANINFNRKGHGMYKYVKISSGDLQDLMEGEIYMKDKFSVLSMTIMEKDSPDSAISGWNSGDGLVISAPAKTRQEALNIFNLLIKDILNCRPLK